MTAPDHTLRKSENPCIEGGIQTCTPIHSPGQLIGLEGPLLGNLSHLQRACAAPSWKVVFGLAGVILRR